MLSALTFKSGLMKIEYSKTTYRNKNLYVEAGDFIVMIVGGPNARKDYHYNESE